MINNLLTTIAAAKILGFSDARVRQLAIKGRLMGQKFGHMWLFTPEAVEQAKTISAKADENQVSRKQSHASASR